MNIRYTYKYIWFGLFLFSAAVFAQNIKKPAVVHDVKIHFSEKINLNFSKKDLQAFIFKKWNAQLQDQLTGRILEKCKANSYYLAAIDSINTDILADSSQLSIHCFVSPKMRFKLSGINYKLPEKIQQNFNRQIEDVLQQYQHQFYTSDQQRLLFKQIINVFENAGYPLCRIETDHFEIDSLNAREHGVQLNLNIIPGDSVAISGLVLGPKNDADVRYLERILHFKPGQFYNHSKINRYRDILTREDFIKTAAVPQIMVGSDSLYYLFLEYEEGTATSFDGVIGYVPPPANDVSKDGYFTGIINLGLINVLGTGRRLDVFWKKPVKESEEFKINYREPFIAGLPLHTSVGMHRLVRDTTYIEWEYELLGQIPLSENLNWQVKFYNRSVFPDSLASRQLRLPKTKAFHTEMGFNWDSRDNLLNPRKGLQLSLLLDYGKQKNIGPQYLLSEDSLVAETAVTKLSAEMEVLLEVLKNQVVSVHLKTILIGQEGVDVQTPDMLWFGGANSIRGYREDQFFADRVGWLNFEYRFLIGPQSNIFAFTDLGYYNRKVPEKKEEFLSGFGLGLRFPAPLGIMQVDYGLAKGLSFSEGKLHFRILNSF